MTDACHQSLELQPPQRLFGFSARWNLGARPTVVGDLRIGPFYLKRVRWELSDVEIEDRDFPLDAHIFTYLVESGGRQRLLSQQKSVYFHEEGAPAPTHLERRMVQGDGLSAPKWHKSDRLWPADDARAFDFIGQGYFEGDVVYLFKHPAADRSAVFADQLARQDAEEHYAEEAARMRY